MGPDAILELFRAYRVPHERIADAISRDRSVATKMMSGKRSIKANELEALTKLAQEYAGGPKPEALPSPSPGAYSGAATAGQLPIREPVQAGAWHEVDPLDQGPAEPKTYPVAPDPAYPGAAQWLSPVLGDSMNALVRGGVAAGIVEGDLVHVVDAIAISYRPATGDVVEVELTRFEGRERQVTLKEIEVKGRKILLWPRSTNTRWRDPIAYEESIRGEHHAEVRIRGKVIRVIRQF